MHTAFHATRPSSRVIQISVATALIMIAFACWSGAFAHDYQLGSLKIEHPWTRATPGGARAAGGFVRITNTGSVPDRLIGGSLVAAGAVEMHETPIEGDVMRMRRLERGIELAPGQTVELRPGAYHVMFMQLDRGFKEGERVGGTLVFEKAGSIAVEFKVEAMGAKGGAHHH